MLGCVAAVTAIVSPSQPGPAVIHNTSISEIGSDSFPAAPEFNAKGVISPQLGTETCLELVRWTGGSRNEHGNATRAGFYPILSNSARVAFHL